MLCGARCNHAQKYDATCLKPETCKTCGKEFGNALEHSYEYSADQNIVTEVCVNGCDHSETAELKLKDGADLTFTGSAITPFEMVYPAGWGGEKKQPSASDYRNNINVGEASIACSYADGVKVSGSFIIQPADIGNATVVLNPAEDVYSGSDCKPSVTVTYPQIGELTADEDYTFSWVDKNGVSVMGVEPVGEYSVVITGKNNFKGTNSASFAVDPADLSDVSVKQEGLLTYTGEEQIPVVATTAATVDGSEVEFVYSTAENGMYGDMPAFKNAGTYTVFYKAMAANHKTYAGSFFVTVEKSEVEAPVLASKTYSGSIMTADVPENALYAVALNNGGMSVGEYEVGLKLTDPANYKWNTTERAEITLTFEIVKAENLWVTEPAIERWTYGESAKAPVAEAKFGEIKVKYVGTANDGTEFESEMAPTLAGSYKAVFTVEQTADFDGIKQEVAFVISKANYDMYAAMWDYSDAYAYDGIEKTVVVVGLPEGVTVSAYYGNAATLVGEYTASVEFACDKNNYNIPALSDLVWKIENEWEPVEYVVSEPNQNGWLNSDFVIAPDEGYLVSLADKAEGEWKTELIFSGETEEGSVTFYLKNIEDGTISLGKTVEYKLDKTPATGKVSFDERNFWEELLNTVSFGLFYKAEVTVEAEAYDGLSGVELVEYFVSDKGLNLEEIKAVTDWTELPEDGVAVTLEDAKIFVYYVRITDKACNAAYLSTDGAEYDITAPVISGVENDETYYTTQVVTVADKNLASVTLNGEAVDGTITLAGNAEETYTIVATDKAGNETTLTVTMKKLSAVDAEIAEITEDDVTSGDIETIEAVIEHTEELLQDEDLTEEEKASLEEMKENAEKLAQKIATVEEAKDAAVSKANEYDLEGVKSSDVEELEALTEVLEELLDGDNLTAEEREELEAVLAQVEELISVVEETAEDCMTVAEAVDACDAGSVTSDDKPVLEAALTAAEELLNRDNLTEEERAELEETKKAAEALLEVIEDAAAAADTENIEKVEDVTAENVEMSNKADLEKAKKDLEKALDEKNGNYTEEEKTVIEDEIKRIEESLAVIEKVEDVESFVGDLPEGIDPDDKEALAEIETAKAAFEGLTDYEKNLVAEETKAKLEKLLADSVAYAIIKGNGSTWEKGGEDVVSFTFNGLFDKFVCVKVNGEIVDPKHYEAKSGSTIITFNKDYLETLAVGNYTITAVYSDGEVQGNFEVCSVPSTGTDNGLALYGALAAFNLTALVVVTFVLKKEKRAR